MKNRKFLMRGGTLGCCIFSNESLILEASFNGAVLLQPFTKYLRQTLVFM